MMFVRYWSLLVDLFWSLLFSDAPSMDHVGGSDVYGGNVISIVVNTELLVFWLDKDVNSVVLGANLLGG